MNAPTLPHSPQQIHQAHCTLQAVVSRNGTPITGARQANPARETGR